MSTGGGYGALRPTFLMSDVVGSTQLWEQDPDAMRSALTEHDRRLLDIVTKHNGQVVKSRGEGDSHFCIFDQPQDAAEAAVKIQGATESLPHSDRAKIRVRIGIHSGPVAAMGDDFYGSTVNRCARIREVAAPGTTLCSSASMAEIRENAGLSLRPLGEHRLRDLSKSEHLYQIYDPESDPGASKVRSLTVLRNNLPQQLTAFVGREALIASIAKTARGERLVTIAGPGGSGKTRLSLQVAACLIDEFAGGAWFVDLSDIDDDGLVTMQIAESLGLTLKSSKNALDELSLLLQTMGPALVILDNSEHLLTQVATTVDRLLRKSPDTRFLVTSREPLRIDGEILFRVDSLSLPEPGHPVTAQSAIRSEAVELFVTRASSRLPSFQLKDANAEAIADIVTRLDGIPLAIEQAASMVTVMSPQQIRARLQDRFRLLRRDHTVGSERHRTLVNAIEWSYNMLDPGEQLLLQRLSVFNGSFTLEASEEVCSDETLPPEEILYILQRLVDKSMVNAVAFEETTRYRLLDTINQFAAERLETGLEPLMARLFDWSLHFVWAADAEISGANQRAALSALTEERPNMRRAMDSGFAASDIRVVDLVLGLRRYWIRAGHLIEGRAYLERCLLFKGQFTTMQQGRLANAIGAFAYRQGEIDAARTAYQQAREVWNQEDNAGEEAAVLSNLGILEGEAGNLDRAAELYLESIRLAGISGRSEVERLALLNGAMNDIDRGHYGDALTALHRAMDLASRDHDEARQATINAAIARVHVLEERLPEAREHLVHAFRIWHGISDPFPTAEALLDVAHLAVASQSLEYAIQAVGGHQRMMEGSGQKPSARAQRQAAELEESLRKRVEPISYKQHLAYGRRISGKETVRLASEFLAEGPEPRDATSPGERSPSS